MGITKECFVHYETLIKNNLVNFTNCSFVEIGNQTVHFDDKPFLAEWARKVHVSNFFVNYMHADISGQEMHRMLGHKYHCVDLDDLNGRIRPFKLDLNKDKCPSPLVNSADVVTNFGKSANILNQYNVFNFMHTTAKMCGIMIHVLPINRWNSGFLNYNPIFFLNLAKANNYKIYGIYTSSDLKYNVLQELVPYAGEHHRDHEYIHVIFQKTNMNNFVTPKM